MKAAAAPVKRIQEVRSFLKRLAQHGYVQLRLEEGIQYVREPKTLPGSVLTHAQVRRMLDAIPTDGAESFRNRAMLEMVYTSPAPATMTIYVDRVEFRNPNVPHWRGRIDPQHFSPFPKNPTICRFMGQIGRYEELGSGVRNVTKYHPFYAPGAAEPTFLDEDLFTAIIPLASATDDSTPQDTPQDTPQVSPQVSRLLAILTSPMTRSELQQRLGLVDREHFRKDYLSPALTTGLVEMTIPDRPNSRLQKYRLTDKGRATSVGMR